MTGRVEERAVWGVARKWLVGKVGEAVAARRGALGETEAAIYIKSAKKDDAKGRFQHS